MSHMIVHQYDIAHNLAAINSFSMTIFSIILYSAVARIYSQPFIYHCVESLQFELIDFNFIDVKENSGRVLILSDHTHSMDNRLCCRRHRLEINMAI